jgi:hypothetical protein
MLMLLLSDGSVMCQHAVNNGAPNSSVWYRLTPDQFGSYVNGTWTSNIHTNNYPRGLCASAVLPDGRVFVAGGEYPKNPDGINETAAANAEIYDPMADAWTIVSPPASLLDPTQLSSQQALYPGSLQLQWFGDMISETLPKGSLLMAPINPRNYGGTLIYNPAANVWSNGPVLQNNISDQFECSWAKLPDGTILTIDPIAQTSQRYIPSLNQYTTDATTPVNIWATSEGSEIGPASMLPNGKIFFEGGNGKNVIYTPSGSTNSGTWTLGPVTPNNLAAGDAPGAMMVNGKLLCLFGSTTGGSATPPYSFYEYDCSNGPAGTFTQVGAPTGGLTLSVQTQTVLFMLDLPDGTVLFEDMTSQLYVYQPDGVPLAAGKPVITSISPNADGSFHLAGTGLNGISEGATYGDDGQMASDYPLVRMTSTISGLVYYGRTYNWSSTGIQTGSTSESTEFTLPAGLPPGNYSLVVTANGIASDPQPFYGPVWVDFNYPGLFQFGDYAEPFETLAQGVNAVQAGGTIDIKPGTSIETFAKITKAMEIRAVGGMVKIGAGH